MKLNNLLIPLLALSASSPVAPPAVISTHLSPQGLFIVVGKFTNAKTGAEIKLPLIVDSGANYMVFPRGTAVLLGLNPEELPSINSGTGNGETTAKKFTLDRFQLGPCVFHHIPALLAGDGLNIPLLGNYMIELLGDVEMRKGELTVRCTESASVEPSRPALAAVAPAKPPRDPS
jgi:clan AA aspartic protease (TIGR02281 family)